MKLNLIGLGLGVTTVLALLKVAGIIAIGWWTVVLPFLIAIGFAFAVLLLFAVIAALVLGLVAASRK